MSKAFPSGKTLIISSYHKACRARDASSEDRDMALSKAVSRLVKYVGMTRSDALASLKNDGGTPG